MSALGAYKKQSLTGGWTRVEMLLQLYDRAIGSIDACKAAHSDEDNIAYAIHLLDSQRVILAINAGLKPGESEVAFNIARLLHFVLSAMEQKDFDAAERVLHELRAGFAAVADEANQLERDGQIPPIPDDDSYCSTA